jgi:hypothetical protein
MAGKANHQGFIITYPGGSGFFGINGRTLFGSEALIYTNREDALRQACRPGLEGCKVQPCDILSHAYEPEELRDADIFQDHIACPI